MSPMHRHELHAGLCAVRAAACLRASVHAPARCRARQVLASVRPLPYGHAMGLNRHAARADIAHTSD